MTQQAKLREVELDTIKTGVSVNLGTSPAAEQLLRRTQLCSGSEDVPPLWLTSALPHKHLADLVLNKMQGKKTKAAVDIRRLRASVLASS